jgi:CheY-like chemotaxis protein
MALPDSPLRIVLIDDNPDHVRIVQWAFRQSGRVDDFTCFMDGHAALQYLIDDHAPKAPDVILLDFNLPRLDGREVLRRLKAAEGTRRIPVIVLSSSERDEDVRKAYELGASNYFSKSVVLDDMDSILKAIHQHWPEQPTK